MAIVANRIGQPILFKELDAYKFTAVPRPGCLTLDTGARPAEATAREIIGHFGLSAAQ